MAIHSNILAWENPMDRGDWWTIVPWGCKRVGHDLVNNNNICVSYFFFLFYTIQWIPWEATEISSHAVSNGILQTSRHLNPNINSMLGQLHVTILDNTEVSGKNKAHSHLHTNQGSRIQGLILNKLISNSHPFLWENDHISACLRVALASPRAFQWCLKRRHLNEHPGTDFKSMGLFKGQECGKETGSLRIIRYTLVYLKWTTYRDLLYGTGNSA